MLEDINAVEALNVVLDNNLPAVNTQLRRYGYKVKNKVQAIDALIKLSGKIRPEEIVGILSVPVIPSKLAKEDRDVLFGPEASELYEINPSGTRTRMIGPMKSTIADQWNDPIWGDGFDLGDAPSSPADEPEEEESSQGINWGDVLGGVLPVVVDVLFDNQESPQPVNNQQPRPTATNWGRIATYGVLLAVLVVVVIISVKMLKK